MDTIDPQFADLLIDAMAEGVFTLDAKGRITLWNRAMEHITGYTADEALGQSCSILNFNRCLNRECPSGMLDCGIFKHGKVDTKSCMLRHKDGHDAPVVKSARVVKDKRGRVLGVVETVTDMSALKKAEQQMAEAAQRLGEMHRLDNILGKSPGMRQIFRAIEAAAASEATILIEGESGAGKELVAGAIHYHSDRASEPLVTVNCSALSESLLESELFGHVAGAFTGAVRNRIGRFEEAHGGSVFLDEIGDISPFIQVKLLRVLQQKTIERVGESKTRAVDIRIIAATHKDLLKLVRAGEFREDLYYRLKVFPIRIPPLRDRREDIPLLIDHFVRQQNAKTGKQIFSVTPEAMRLLMDYPWPGNVRELENAVEHAFVLATGHHINTGELPAEIRSPLGAAFAPVARAAAFETGGRVKLNRERLLAELEACDWNKAEVARRVGYSRTAVWKYMKRWNIPLRPAKESVAIPDAPADVA